VAPYGEMLVGAARPASHLGVVGRYRRADQLDGRDTKVSGDPEGGAEVSRGGGFDQNHCGDRHDPDILPVIAYGCIDSSGGNGTAERRVRRVEALMVVWLRGRSGKNADPDRA